MILLIPVNGVLANATKKLQIQQMKYKDKRVKMMSEILSGIKVRHLASFLLQGCESFQDGVVTVVILLKYFLWRPLKDFLGKLLSFESLRNFFCKLT